MGVYEDGTRDCPRCLVNDKPNPARVRGPLELCASCAQATSSEVASGFAQLAPYMAKHLRLTDWLIQHGRSPI